MTINPDAWESLRSFTHARIALGRAGHAVPTKELLNFRLAHSQARDSVWREVDFSSIKDSLKASDMVTHEVQSECTDKQNYLLSPGQGRVLAAQSRLVLGDASHLQESVDCVIVVADGLSANAVHVNAAIFVTQCDTQLKKMGLSLAPVILARYGRVALGDDIGATLNARSVLMVIGERPGLGSSDSLSVYFTYGPRADRRDNDRNCISNIHAAGIAPETAARMAAFLAQQALIRQLSGVDLKVEYPALAKTSQDT